VQQCFLAAPWQGIPVRSLARCLTGLASSDTVLCGRLMPALLECFLIQVILNLQPRSFAASCQDILPGALERSVTPPGIVLPPSAQAPDLVLTSDPLVTISTESLFDNWIWRLFYLSRTCALNHKLPSKFPSLLCLFYSVSETEYFEPSPRESASLRPSHRSQLASCNRCAVLVVPH
jgi:hypothetical protein